MTAPYVVACALTLVIAGLLSLEIALRGAVVALRVMGLIGLLCLNLLLLGARWLMTQAPRQR